MGGIYSRLLAYITATATTTAAAATTASTICSSKQILHVEILLIDVITSSYDGESFLTVRGNQPAIDGIFILTVSSYGEEAGSSITFIGTGYNIHYFVTLAVVKACKFRLITHFIVYLNFINYFGR